MLHNKWNRPNSQTLFDLYNATVALKNRHTDNSEFQNLKSQSNSSKTRKNNCYVQNTNNNDTCKSIICVKYGRTGFLFMGCVSVTLWTCEAVYVTCDMSLTSYANTIYCITYTVYSLGSHLGQICDQGYLGKVHSCVHFEEKGRNFVLFLHRICHDRIPILLLAYYRMIAVERRKHKIGLKVIWTRDVRTACP